MRRKTDGADRPIELRDVLNAQYRAALSMLRQAVHDCPDGLWRSGQGHNAPYWRITFHALFFTHFYLLAHPSGLQRWPKHRGQLEDLSGPAATETEVYSKADMLEYCEYIEGMLDDRLDAMDLAAPDCGFHWYKQGKLEHQLNSIRHIQHHIGQLADRLRAVTGKGIAWPTAAVGNVT